MASFLGIPTIYYTMSNS